MQFNRFFIAAVAAATIAVPALAQDVKDVSAGKAKTAVCATCHGVDGNSASSAFPNLAGQSWRYIYVELKDYKEGRRSNPIMSPMAANLSREDMIDIGNYYAAQVAKPSTFKADEARIKLGKAKADENLCVMCHLGGFAGQNEIPRVAGQQYDYIVKQMHDFKEGHRTNDAGNMSSVSKSLSDEDIINLGHYITSIR